MDRINWFFKVASEPSYLTHCQVIFELKSHNLPPLSIWFPSELLSRGTEAVYDSCLTGLKGERESPSGHEGIFIEQRASGSGREHVSGPFEI